MLPGNTHDPVTECGTFGTNTPSIYTFHVIAFGEHASTTDGVGRVTPHIEHEYGEAFTSIVAGTLTTGARLSSTNIICTASL
ncbi:MAG TPA: hypothetical protein PLI89_13925, partial [Chitinophagales bacterium]|nr:hypothetical protein [Chitinophagales bacterium]